MSEKLLEIKDLAVSYFGYADEVQSVRRVSFDANRSETVAAVGESGCGKTTCGRTCLGMYNKSGGQVTYLDKDIHALKGAELFAFKKEAQMIFQDPYASLAPRMTVSDIVAEGLDIHKTCKSRAERTDKVYELLNMVGLNKEHADRFIHEFSGGQRIGIAHDLSMVKHISDRVGVMYLGNIVEITSSGELYSRPLHPYTQALLSAIPIPNPDIEAQREATRIRLEGEVPSPINPPPGCKFAGRCRYATERCHQEMPALRDMGSGHLVACFALNQR